LIFNETFCHVPWNDEEAWMGLEGLEEKKKIYLFGS